MGLPERYGVAGIFERTQMPGARMGHKQIRSGAPFPLEPERARKMQIGGIGIDHQPVRIAQPSWYRETGKNCLCFGKRGQARKRVAAGLLVTELARQNEIRLDPKRLNETLQLIASTYEEPQQVIELYRQDANLMQSLQARVMEEQVMDWIASKADATEQTLSFDQVMRPGQSG